MEFVHCASREELKISAVRLSWGMGVVGLCVLLALVWAAQVLFLDRIVATADLQTHYRWATQFTESIRDGWWYPRWTPLSHMGLGDPTFVYYSPLFYFAVAGVDSLTRDIWLAMRMVVAASVVFLGIAGYCCLRRYVEPRYAAIGAAVLQLLPMPFFLVHFYSALPWACAAPLVVIVLLLSVRPQREVLNPALAIAVAALAMAHVLSAFMALICVGTAQLAMGFGRPAGLAIRHLANWASSVAVGLALAGIYLVPALTSQSLVNPAGWFDPVYMNWRNSFIFPLFTGQRWWSIQWILPLAPIGGLAVSLGVLATFRGSGRTAEYCALAALTGAGVVAMILASELAYPLYRFGVLTVVQQPYRFAYVGTLSAALTVPLALSIVSRSRSRARLSLHALVILQAALSLLVFGLLQWRVAQEGRPAELGARTLQGNFGQPEYHTASRGLDWEAYVKRGGLAGFCVRAGAECRPLTEQANKWIWEVSSFGPVELVLPVFAFPAWSAVVDGTATPIGVDRSTGLIMLTVPAGRHQVVVEWTGLQAERSGRYVSLVAATLLSGYVLWGLRRRRHA